MTKNIIEHECVKSECNENITLEWDKRAKMCQCGMRYRYNPTGGATMKANRKDGTDWLKNSRLRKTRTE